MAGNRQLKTGAAILAGALLLAACNRHDDSIWDGSGLEATPGIAPVSDVPATLDNTASTVPLSHDEAARQLLDGFNANAKQGHSDAALIAAVFKRRPASLDTCADAYVKALEAGESDFEAGRACGAAIRSVVVEEGVSAILKGDDQTVADHAAVTLEEYRLFARENVQDCALTAAGLMPLPGSAELARLREKESALTIKLMNQPADSTRAVTPLPEMNDWLVALGRAHPEAQRGAALIGQTDPTDDEAAAICQTMITIFDELEKLPVQERAAHYRRMTSM